MVRSRNGDEEQFLPREGWRPGARQDALREARLRLTAEEVRLLTEGPHQAQ